MKGAGKFFDNLESFICVFLLALFISLIFLQIILRHLAIPLPWTEELARYAFLWFVLFAGCHAARLDVFNRVTAQFSFMRPALVNVFLCAGDLIWLAFSLIMVWQGLRAVMRLDEFAYLTPALDWNLKYVYLAFPASFALMSFRIMQQIIKRIKKI